MTHVYIASPTHYGCEPEYVYSLLRTLAALRDAGISYSVDLHPGESLITRARNKIVAKFLASPATHLFFIDSDQSWRPEDALRVIQADKAIVGALIPKKGIDWERVREAVQRGVVDVEGYGAQYVINPENVTVTVDAAGCVPVFAVGSGFMLIARRVVEDIIAARSDIAYRSDDTEGDATPLWAVFDCAIDPDTRRYLSEDFEFCRRAKAAGHQPFLHVGAQGIGHIGRHHFRGNVESAFFRHRADGTR